jgi:hypothetical protein
VFGTDADAALPPTHFDLPELEERLDVAAVALPFWHEPSPDLDVTRATALYELSLRYYVLGLAWAGSPYAFHVLGSATALSLPAYARVRGYPKRDAAEDFYLLNKIAKVGAVVRAPGPGVRIRSRQSDRTPFGTGRGVANALRNGIPSFYSPHVFRSLADFLRMLGAFCAEGNTRSFEPALSVLESGERAAFSAFLSHGDVQTALRAASEQAKTPEARWRRVHSFFDAFRTLKLIHLLRDKVAPNVPWQEALDGAPFVPDAARALIRENDPAHTALRRALSDSEKELASLLGPTVPPVARGKRESWQPSRPA